MFVCDYNLTCQQQWKLEPDSVVLLQLQHRCHAEVDWILTGNPPKTHQCEQLMRVNEVTRATTTELHKMQHYAVTFCHVLLQNIINVRFPQQNIEHQGHSVPLGSEGLMRVRTKDPFSYLKSLYKTENPHQARVFIYC